MDDLNDIKKKDFTRVLDIYVQHTYKPLVNPNTVMGKSINTKEKALDCEQAFIKLLTPYLNEKGVTESIIGDKIKMISEFFDRLENGKRYNCEKYRLLGFCFVLNLTLAETNSVMTKAGYVLSSNEKVDVVIQFFLKNETYDFELLNQAFLDYEIL